MTKAAFWGNVPMDANRQPPRRNPPLLTDAEVIERLPEVWKALDEFNEGFWFEAHETLEDLWYVSPWPARQFFQGVIQAAAAFVHLARRQPEGAVKLLREAHAKLAPFAPEYLGVDVGTLVRDLDGARRAIAALDPSECDAYRASVPRVAFHRIRPQTTVREGIAPARRA